MIIDGNSLMHRAFYALPPLVDAQGRYTNAVYGFLTMLLRVIEEENPSNLVVAFDLKGPTIRHEIYEDYKGTRKKTPDELVGQFELVHSVLEAMRIKVVEVPGYEADDLIGTIAKNFPGKEVLVVTGDRDALQLVDERIEILLTKKGISEIARFGLGEIEEVYGVTPEQLIDVKALMGDSSDNIPGVPGVGEKTALKLIKEFGSLESVLENIDKVGGKKLPELLREYADQARLSKELARIICEVELPFEDYRVEVYDEEALYKLLDELGFKTLIKRMDLSVDVDMETYDVKGYVLKDQEELKAILEGIKPTDRVGLFPLIKTEKKQAKLVGYSVAYQESEAWKVALLPYRDVSKHIADFIGNRASRQQVVLWQGKEVWRNILSSSNKLCCPIESDVDSSFFDIEIAAYLLDPSRSSYEVADLAQRYLGSSVVFSDEWWQTEESMLEYAGQLGVILMNLHEALAVELANLGMTELFYRMEMPLLFVLASMEHQGFLLDREQLKAMEEELDLKIGELQEEIFRLAGFEFNINSTQQLGKVLFEELDLPVTKKTKTGYSTDSEVLESLLDKHPIVELILEYRQLVKLRSTYIIGLREVVDKDSGRVHTTFKQTVTATGRLSSTEPNLQNIPVRMELGRRLRKVFVAPEGHLLLAADYSQIELRLLAHISQDEKLIKAFADGEDIHTRTAAEVFGVDLNEVSAEMRSAAKAVNFGIIYGISDYGLARGLHIGRGQAQAYIDSYLERYPGVRKYMQSVVANAYEDGYVRTMFQRIRYLPELNSRIWHRRQFAERTALNTPIQGSAADIIKLAMIRVFQRLQQEKLDSKLLLQVHDELILEVADNEVRVVTEILKQEMEEVVALSVPLEVDIKVGPNWYEMVKIDA